MKFRFLVLIFVKVEALYDYNSVHTPDESLPFSHCYPRWH